MPAMADDRGNEVVADAAMKALFSAWGDVSGKLQACGQEQAAARIHDQAEAITNILATRAIRRRIERERAAGREENWVSSGARLSSAKFSGYMADFTIKEMLLQSVHGLH